MTLLMALSLMVLPPTSPDDAWSPQQSGSTARLRGVSVVDEQTAWASGAGGTLLATGDAGLSWRKVEVHVRDSDALDFRDVEAVDARTVYLLSIGEGEKSRIFKTTDGGASWTSLYQNRDPKGFLDAIAFWDANHGLVLGDPVDGRFTVLTTSDGGKTWTPVEPSGMPPSLPGEGAFAASGTCLVVQRDGLAWFGTGGGKTPRVFRSTDRGRSWTVHETPIRAGSPTTGIFSLAFRDADHGVAVGGSYDREGVSGQVAATTADGGKTWSLPAGDEPRGFRSAVAFPRQDDPSRVIAMGPSGSDVSTDGGQSWKPLGDSGFHAIDFTPSGVGWAVGEQGRIARIEVLPSRCFEITYRAALKAVPGDAKRADLWVPLSRTDRNQTIERLTITASEPVDISQEARYGNSVLHLSSDGAGNPPSVTITIRATRRENAVRPERLEEPERTRYLAEEPLVPLGGAVADLAREATSGQAALEKARAIYDKVTGMMAYARMPKLGLAGDGPRRRGLREGPHPPHRPQDDHPPRMAPCLHEHGNPIQSDAQRGVSGLRRAEVQIPDGRGRPHRR